MSVTGLKNILAAAVIGGALSGCGNEDSISSHSPQTALDRAFSEIPNPALKEATSSGQYAAIDISEEEAKNDKDAVCYELNSKTFCKKLGMRLP